MNKKITNMFNNLDNCKGGKEAVSLFIPIKVKENVVDGAFLYNNQPTTQKSRPSAKVVFDYSTGTLLEYVNARVSDFVDTETHPFDKMMDYSLTYAKKLSEQAALIKKANELYPTVRELAYKTELTSEGIKTIKEYQEVLTKATPETLMPFYRALSPAYFEWVESLN